MESTITQIDWLPIIWTAIALVGFVASLLGAADSFAVWHNKDWTGEDALQTLAYHQFRRSALRSLETLLFIVAGFSVLMPIGQGWLTQGSLVAALVLVTLSEILDRMYVYSAKQSVMKSRNGGEEAHE